MITLWIYSLPLLLVAALVYWLMRKSAPWLRHLVTVTIWPLLPLVLTVWVVVVGDQLPPDAELIDPGTLEGG